jgi:hypothetical protein
MKTEFQLVFQSSVYPLIHLSSLPKYSPGDYNLETVSIYSMSMYHHGNYTLEFICPRITMEFKHKNWYWQQNSYLLWVYLLFLKLTVHSTYTEELQRNELIKL